MTVDQFVAKWNNKYDDFDGQYSTQCKDLFSRYNQDVVGNPNYVWGDAWELYSKAPDEYYEKILNTASFVPKKGDVCIWKQSFGGLGHVAVCLDGCTVNSLRVFGQNYPKVSKKNADGSWTRGSPCQIVTMSYDRVNGFLRPKNKGVGMQVWEHGQDIRFNDEQAKELISVLAKKTPTNYHLRGWELMHEIYADNQVIINAKDNLINAKTQENSKLLADYNTCQANLTLSEKAVKDVKNKADKLDKELSQLREDCNDKVNELTLALTNKENEITRLKQQTSKELTWGDIFNLIISKIRRE